MTNLVLRVRVGGRSIAAIIAGLRTLQGRHAWGKDVSRSSRAGRRKGASISVTQVKFWVGWVWDSGFRVHGFLVRDLQRLSPP